MRLKEDTKGRLCTVDQKSVGKAPCSVRGMEPDMRAAERMLCGCCLRKRVLRLCRQAGRAAGNGVGCAGCFYGVLYGQGKKQTFDIGWRHLMRLREIRDIFMPHMCGAYFRPCICAAYMPRGDILCVCEAVYSHCAPPREGKSASGKPAFLSNAAKARKNGSRLGDFRKEQLFCRSDAAGAARVGQIFLRTRFMRQFAPLPALH